MFLYLLTCETASSFPFPSPVVTVLIQGLCMSVFLTVKVLLYPCSVRMLSDFCALTAVA